ncbi:TrkH family potassium uptake protein [Methanogenium sp. S4BF]|uniref:TrkH family potassium uptake protein n=1 Tax=Methanogenium sp. S4BF TaxID=1789226 RepID=UPI0024162979|nr:TrkH family potassium uptake protein [Methanogenium sp. S4BF]WFN33742.1 TrkH family potassium uptake protein [Methanogenium sp. S4BF]
MDRLHQYLTLTTDIGTILRYISAGTCIPLAVALIFREFDMLLPMASVPVVLFCIGTVLIRLPATEREPRLSMSLFSVAAIWLICALVGALPFVFGAGMPYIDGFFEAMSGWTDTGMTMARDVDALPETLIFWRTLMEWFGGIGIVAFTVALLNRSSVSRLRLYSSERMEGRSDAFMPSVVEQGAQMWLIYLFLTLAGVLLILCSGVPLWDAVNIAMTAISTGGFSIHSGGIPSYDNRLLELLIIPVMIAGALPFKIYYLMYRKREFRLFHDEQAILLFLLILLGFVIITGDLIVFNGLEQWSAVINGLFMASAAVTSTGFQTVDLVVWEPVSVLFLTMLVFIGGSSGSTAGGVKLSRVMIGLKGIKYWFRRSFVSPKAMIPLRYNGKTFQRADAEFLVSRNMLTFILFLIPILFALVIIMHFEQPDIDTTLVIFDVVSATCNNGISTGFVTPDLTVWSKLVLIIQMWLGRLEVMAVMVFFIGLIRGFDW